MSNDDKRPTLGFDGRTVNPSDLERMALEQLAAEVAGEQQSDDNTVEVVVTRGMLRRWALELDRGAELEGGGPAAKAADVVARGMRAVLADQPELTS